MPAAAEPVDAAGAAVEVARNALAAAEAVATQAYETYNAEANLVNQQMFTIKANKVDLASRALGRAWAALVEVVVGDFRWAH